nr:hypothetical protein [Tanacetum cinerariifolium]
RLAEEYSPTTLSSSDISIFHKRITSDKIAVAKGNRKDLDIDSRIGVDRILANIPSDATSAEVERVLWEGANPMVAHTEYGYFFIRAAHEMSSDILRETPLHLAARTPGLATREIAKFLADKGADINHEANDGHTPLKMALTARNLTGIERSLMIELLLSYGAEGELNQDLEGRRSNSKGLRIMGIT